MNCKHLLLFALFLVAVSQQLMAQQRMAGEEKQEAIDRYLAFQDELNLTEEQKPKVDEINRTYFEGIKQLKNSNTTRLDKYRTYKDLSSRRDEQMKHVLDREQYKLYKKFQAETKDNLRERRKANQP